MYLKRIVDDMLDDHMNTFGGTLVIGPKGSGKTTTCIQKAKSVIKFQDADKRNSYLNIVDTQPTILLKEEKPILFDEWQDAPKIWGAIRNSMDEEQKKGMYLLTGSTSQKVEVPHTGTLRISTLKMYTMSLYESRESNGTVSLSSLFDDTDSFDGCKSDLSFDGLVESICRGGWPQSLDLHTDKYLKVFLNDLVEQICERDASAVDGKKRNPKWVKAILMSYSRNICTTANFNTIYQDVFPSTGMSKSTFDDYLNALNKLYLFEDLDAWSPSIRSKTAIRTSGKRNVTDPALAVATMGINSKYFIDDFKTLGFLFESLCLRDLRVYSSKNYGVLSFYRDRYGLEADAVLHIDDGRYALIEFKLGQKEIDKGAEHLCRLEELIKEYNEKEKQCPLRLPTLKLVITGGEYGYRRNDGVFVIPIGCLKD